MRSSAVPKTRPELRDGFRQGVSKEMIIALGGSFTMPAELHHKTGGSFVPFASRRSAEIPIPSAQVRMEAAPGNMQSRTVVSDTFLGLPIPIVEDLKSELGQTFSCTEGGSKPECVNCPYFKLMGPEADSSLPTPPLLDDTNDVSGHPGNNGQLLARNFIDLSTIIALAAFVSVGSAFVVIRLRHITSWNRPLLAI